MSTQANTSTPTSDAQEVNGRFLDVVHADRAKQTITLACGGCSAVNKVNVPKKVYHVVIAGGGGCGIFDSNVIADAFVLGVSGATRVKADSFEEAVSTLNLAIAQSTLAVLDRPAVATAN